MLPKTDASAVPVKPGLPFEEHWLGGRKAFLTPVLHPMPDIEYFNNLIGVTVHDNLRGADNLAGALDFAGTPCQSLDAVKYRLSHAAGSIGIVLLNVLDSGLELVGRCGWAPNAPHGSKSRFDAPHHVVVVDKLASLGLRNAFLHTDDEAGLIFQHAGNRSQLLGVLAAGKGDLSFNVG